MDKYEINYFFNEDNDLNDLLIKVLNQELKQYFEKINNIKKMLFNLKYAKLKG